MIKLIGGIVVAVIVVFAVNGFGDLVYQASEPAEHAQIRGEALNETPTVTTADTGASEAPTVSTTDQPVGSSAAGAAAEATAEPQLAGLVGDPMAGEKTARACVACHSFDEGGPNKVGPNLWNVVGSDIAAHEGFNYSDAVKGLEGQWTTDTLDQWLTDPKAFAPGNKMTYAGIKDDAKRADVIAYLQTLQPEDDLQAMAAEAGGAPEQPAPEQPAPDQPATDQPAAEQPAADQPAADAQPAAAAGDPAAGQKVARACQACHTFDQGGPNRVGPNLFGIVGMDIASHEGFNYSDALKGLDGTWTMEALDQWLTDPKSFAPGNKMTYAGVKDEAKRQDLLAYLQSLK